MPNISNFKGETQHYVVKLPKSVGARQYCPKIQQVPGTRGNHTNSSPESSHILASLGKWTSAKTNFVTLIPEKNNCVIVTTAKVIEKFEVKFNDS